MVHPLLRSPSIVRVSCGVPIARLLLLAEATTLAQRHLSKLDRTQRRRLLTLLVRSRGWPPSLTAAERLELLYLAGRLEPRLFFATALRRLNPVPLPRRQLYGRRGGGTRAALPR